MRHYLRRRSVVCLFLSFAMCCSLSCRKRSPAEELLDAASNGDAAKCVQLIKSGVPVESIDSAGRTALDWAVEKQHIEVVQTLLDMGANVNHVDTHNGATPLMYTAVALNWKGWPPSTRDERNRIAVLLIEHGANVNYAEPEGNTTLHLAVQDRNPELIRILLKAGASKAPKTKQGYTPLDMARAPVYAPNDAVIEALEKSR